MQIRYSDFLNIISVLTVQKTLRITAVSGTLILHKHVYDVALCWGQLCSYRGNDVHFNSSSGINHQCCHRVDVQVASGYVQLCSQMGKDIQFDSFCCINQQSCHRKLR